MPPSCAVGGCTNTDKSRSCRGRDFLIFHVVPKDARRRASWDRRINRQPEHARRLKKYCVCSDHFNELDYDQSYFMRYSCLGYTKGMKLPLRDDAVPNTNRDTGELRLFLYKFVQEPIGPTNKKRRINPRILGQMDEFSSKIDTCQYPYSSSSSTADVCGALSSDEQALVTLPHLSATDQIVHPGVSHSPSGVSHSPSGAVESGIEVSTYLSMETQTDISWVNELSYLLTPHNEVDPPPYYESDHSEEFHATVFANTNQDRLNRRCEYWCSCGGCVTMGSEEECVCCRESYMIRRLIGQHLECVTRTARFKEFVVNADGLKYARCLHALTIEDEGRRQRYLSTDISKPATMRLLAYKAFIDLLSMSEFDRNIRYILPACVVTAIRRQYPNTNGEPYKGFCTAISSKESAILP